MSARVFIGSPFWMLDSLRRRLHSALSMAGHVPWCWEIEGQRQRGGEVHRISQAIKSSDFVVAIFERRPGSILKGTEYYYTEFEWLLARTLGKPIHLYLKGHCRTPPLQRLSVVLTSLLPTPDSSTLCESDDEIISDALQKADTFSSHPAPVISGGPWPSLITDREYIEREFSYLRGLVQQEDYNLAGQRAASIPLVHTRIPDRDVAVAYAQLLGLSASVAANTAQNCFASAAAKLQVNILINAGMADEALAAIQALSGILNMVGLRSEARAWNAYGLERSRSLSLGNLRQAFWDSRASIMRKTGHPYLAEMYFRSALQAEQTEDGHAYLGGRLAGTLSLSSDPRKTSEAVTLVEGLLGHLSKGLKPMTRAIVYREAAHVALAAGELSKVGRFLVEGKAICKRYGYTHTLSTLEAFAVGTGL